MRRVSQYFPSSATLRASCLVASALALLVTPASAEAPTDHGGSLQTLEALVEQWSQLRRAMADEARAWDRQKRQWLTEMDLLKQEKTELLAEIETATQAETSAAEERQAAQQSEERLQQMMDGLAPMLEQAEAALQAWPPRLPPSLREPLEPAFQKLQSPRTSGQAESTGIRLQRVVALYSEIEKLQQNTHAVKEVLPMPDGARREVDICYLGLSRGFAVSPDDAWAGIGLPTDVGWVWNSRPELASDIRNAIEMHHNRHATDVQALPLAAVEVSP